MWVRDRVLACVSLIYMPLNGLPLCRLFPSEQKPSLLINTLLLLHMCPESMCVCLCVCVCVCVCVCLCVCYLQVLLPGGQRRALLQPLQSDTQYKVTVTPVYADGQDGISVSVLGATCKPCKHPTHSDIPIHKQTHTHTPLNY